MEDEIKTNFGKLWPSHVALLNTFLIECRGTFGGDLDQFLILSVIGDRTFSQKHADPKLNFDGFCGGDAAGTPSIDINIRSIADYSGIPRETVRRKVQELIDRGWVERNEECYLVATAAARKDLEHLTLATIKYISRLKTL